jgi:osmotically-inducible protein OsmY
VLITGSLLLNGQAPDNTKTNQRDREPGAVTADDQGMSKADREVAQKIRKAVVDDKSLSTYAHNVKIIVQEGKVTLKGPVRSAEEKTTVNSKAVAVVGAAKVTNELDIVLDSK